MKLTDMYGYSAYLSMLDNTELVQTKKQIKEQYLQHLLTIKEAHERVKKRSDPLIQSHLEGNLIRHLDQMKCLPGFEKAPQDYSRSAKSRSGMPKVRSRTSFRLKSTDNDIRSGDQENRVQTTDPKAKHRRLKKLAKAPSSKRRILSL